MTVVADTNLVQPNLVRPSSLLAGVATRVPLASVFAVVAIGNVLAAFDGGPPLHNLLSAVLWGMFAIMVVVRPVPLRRSGSLAGAAVAIAAQLDFIVLGIVAGSSGSGAALAVGNVLLVAGLAFAIVSVAVLGRCFGVLPDVRGLVVRGPYRLVRHPLYLGELLALLGVLIGSEHWALALPVWVLGLVLQLVRTRYEEQTLRAQFVEYGDYAAHTRRLIPGLV